MASDSKKSSSHLVMASTRQALGQTKTCLPARHDRCRSPFHYSSLTISDHHPRNTSLSVLGASILSPECVPAFPSSLILRRLVLRFHFRWKTRPNPRQAPAV